MSIDILGMLTRVDRPRSGECVICGGSETVGSQHYRCVRELAREYASFINTAVFVTENGRYVSLDYDRDETGAWLLLEEGK